LTQEQLVEYITQRVLEQLRGPALRLIPVGVSARHVHLSREHMDALFGPGSELTVRNWLYQPGTFAANETVTLIGPRRIIQNVRIVGPLARHTQVEISRTDAIQLGIDAPVRRSGDHEGTPGAVLVGPRGVVRLERGVIVVQRHIHCSPEEAEALGIRDGELVRVRAPGQKAVVFENVLVRVSPNFRLEFHVDTDEANAAELTCHSLVELLPG